MINLTLPQVQKWQRGLFRKKVAEKGPRLKIDEPSFLLFKIDSGQCYDPAFGQSFTNLLTLISAELDFREVEDFKRRISLDNLQYELLERYKSLVFTAMRRWHIWDDQMGQIGSL